MVRAFQVVYGILTLIIFLKVECWKLGIISYSVSPFKNHTGSLKPSQCWQHHVPTQSLSVTLKTSLMSYLILMAYNTLNSAQTDIQNVPIDRFIDTHKLLIMLMFH